MNLTIVIPNRNRSMSTVKRTLNTIAQQLNGQVKVVVVDYGSESMYQDDLQSFIDSLEKVSLINCPTQGQLWQKTRAINIALKLCDTPYFMVADMDMLFHPNFVTKIQHYMRPDEVHYFKVGILTEEESKLEKEFETYQVKFYTNEEATGMTLFPTAILKGVNGFDEFYHGWGSEDTDVHVRLRNQGIPVHFNQDEALLLHQWHPKFYRSKESTAPYHHYLERVNYEYIKLSRKHKKIQSNIGNEWGVLPDALKYKALDTPDTTVQCTSTLNAITALCFQLSEGVWNGVVQFVVQLHPEATSLKTTIKKIAKKKTPQFITLEEANSMLLETIIKNHRNIPYNYSFNRTKEIIVCTMNLSSL
ncbi:glycosyltransferase family A protein [uncultured Dokdonia sp.]|uniref:glycosyltransferase family 2 protein n=1 Tax=uncultured Dokdonia sp. TaxID=575653 RepID=UPI0026097D1A|nr:glycosyltransferase family A protein [uncultured Dokdonia sp.]